jgi:Spy/CpxP family protein refolding chaperone
LLLFAVQAFAQVPNDSPAVEAKRIELQEALKKFTPRHPDVVRLQTELQEIKKNQGNPLLPPFRKPDALAPVSPLTALQGSLRGTFWRNPEWVKALELTTDQQNKMDDVYRQNRLKLIDLSAALQKEELLLEPLIGRTRPAPEAEAKILTQIDRIAEARAELEKANSRMLISLLQVLTPEQWTKLPQQPTRKVFPFK